MKGSGGSDTALDFDLSRVKNALLKIETSPTIFEGLYQAIVEDIRFVESLPDLIERQRSGFDLLGALVADPEREDFDGFVLELVRGLSRPEAEALAGEIARLVKLLELEAGRPQKPA